MTTPVTRIVASALLLGQGACIAFSISKGDKPLIPPMSESTRNAGQGNSVLHADAVGPKAVTGKEPPNRLFARDGTSCIVSADKYDRITPGASAWCIWSRTGR